MTDDWITPKEIKDKYPYFDPCPFGHDLQIWDGLEIEWPETVFVNPPYSNIGDWLAKFHNSPKTKLAVFLLPVWTDRRWFHDFIVPYKNKIEFIKGRVKFEGGKYHPTFPSMIVTLWR